MAHERLIVIVDDDVADRKRLVDEFCRSGFAVSEADVLGSVESPSLATAAAIVFEPASAHSDVPSTLTEVRRVTDLPLIVVSAAAEDEDRIIGLELGADDYIAKPFNPREVVARVQAVLRRSAPSNLHSDLVFGQMTIRARSREVLVADRRCDLTPREFDLLSFLAASPSTVFSREDLLDGVWNSSARWQSVATVTEHIRRIRSKLAMNGEETRIETVWGVGYRFDPR